MSDTQPRKPAGTPEGGRYDTTSGGGSDADLDEWALTDDRQNGHNPFDPTPIDIPGLEADIVRALPERYAGAHILTFDADGTVTGVDGDGRKFTDTTDPQVGRLFWSVPDDLPKPPRTQGRLERVGDGWRTVPGGLPDAGRPKRAKRDGEPWCVKAARRRYADRYADVRALQDGRILVELTDGTIRVMDAPDWVPAQPRGMRRIHVKSGRWRLVPADSMDDGWVMTCVTKADLDYYAKLGRQVAGPEFDHVIRVDGTGRLTIARTDGDTGTIQLPDDEPRPVPGTVLQCGRDVEKTPRQAEADDGREWQGRERSAPSPGRTNTRRRERETPAPPARTSRVVEMVSSILAPLVSLFIR